jgi:hypothetical protein
VAEKIMKAIKTSYVTEFLAFEQRFLELEKEGG